MQHAEAKKEIDSNIISDEQQLLQNEDKDTKGFPKQYSKETVSLYKASVDYNCKTWLIRFTDIDYQGCLSKFIMNKDRPPLFVNRNKLFYKKEPNKIGCYNAWNWTVVPNINNPERDYVTTEYSHHIIPMKIVKLTEWDSIESVISILKNGYEFKAYSKKIMFTINKEKEIYEGILCHVKDIENHNGVLSLSDYVIQLPVYEFRMNDAVIDDYGTIFFGKVYAGVPSRLYRVKNHMDIIKTIVLEAISWSNYKARSIIRAEYKCFKDLIASISSEDIIKKIALTYNCNTTIANELLEQFIFKVSDYLDVDCLEDDVIKSALQNNKLLMERAKTLI